jgi:hypothetical protein
MIYSSSWNLVGVRKILFALVTVLFLICSIQSVSLVPFVIAQPTVNAYVPRIDIISPPYPPNRYENNTVELKIHVRMLEGSPRPSNFSFSLDGNPLVNLENFTTTSKSYWAPYVFTLFIAKINLESLSEGNHTINAYADGLSTSRSFKVNSHYHPTVVKILSPTNQTYSNRVPLVFTVNMPIKGAYYYMYRDFDAVFENHFNGNITIDNLSDGNYVLHLYVTTENGDEPASTFFSVSNNTTEDVLPYAIGIVTLLIVVGLLVYLKRHYNNKLTDKQSFKFLEVDFF